MQDAMPPLEINRRSPPQTSTPKPKFHSYPFWSPRFWHGMRLGDAWRLSAANRFRIHPLRIPMALLVAVSGCMHSALHRVERWKYKTLIDNTKIEHPPVFIIGHWRSGTTHLHELMVRDEQFGFPTTYECFVPHHFLVSHRILPKLFGFLLPAKRPMDNMPAGFDHPQEDEFALLTLGAPTPYVRFAFPNNPPRYLEFLDMRDTQADDLQRFKSEMLGFVRRLTLLKKKRLILKSPPHTGRLRVLSELFPGAIFIHIARDPRSIFPSTKRLWQALDEVQGLQFPRNEGLDEFVLSCFERMYRGYDEQRREIPAERLYELRYEDLIKDPIGELRKLYAAMKWTHFEEVRPRFEAYLSEQKDYRTNQHELAPQYVAQIRTRWAAYCQRYGYDLG